MANVSCVIAAYNEAERIEHVLAAVEHHPLIDEIIVVNDGSTDTTEKTVQKFSTIKLINLRKNQGKTNALLTGIYATKNELVLLLDADLRHVSATNISDLVSPVIKGETDIAMSLRGNSLFFFRWLGIDFISGERVFSKKLIGDGNAFSAAARFGFETILNKKIIAGDKRVKIVSWPKVMHARKTQKHGWLKGSALDIIMVWQIIKTTGFLGVAKQIRKLKSLRV